MTPSAASRVLAHHIARLGLDAFLTQERELTRALLAPACDEAPALQTIQARRLGLLLFSTTHPAHWPIWVCDRTIPIEAHRLVGAEAVRGDLFYALAREQATKAPQTPVFESQGDLPFLQEVLANLPPPHVPLMTPPQATTESNHGDLMTAAGAGILVRRAIARARSSGQPTWLVVLREPKVASTDRWAAWEAAIGAQTGVTAVVLDDWGLHGAVWSIPDLQAMDPEVGIWRAGRAQVTAFCATPAQVCAMALVSRAVSDLERVKVFHREVGDPAAVILSLSRLMQRHPGLDAIPTWLGALADYALIRARPWRWDDFATVPHWNRQVDPRISALLETQFGCLVLPNEQPSERFNPVALRP